MITKIDLLFWKYSFFFLISRISKVDDLKDEVYEIDTEVDQVDEVIFFFILDLFFNILY